ERSVDEREPSDSARGTPVGPARRAGHARVRDVPAVDQAGRGPAGQGPARVAVPHRRAARRPRAGAARRGGPRGEPARTHQVLADRGRSAGAADLGGRDAARAGQRVPPIPRRPGRGAPSAPGEGRRLSRQVHRRTCRRDRGDRAGGGTGQRLRRAGGVLDVLVVPAGGEAHRAGLDPPPGRAHQERGTGMAEISDTKPAPQLTTVAVEKPWRALWALVLGFFMILVDSTIVSVATPAIMQHFGADVNLVIWVTSAYLVAYA